MDQYMCLLLHPDSARDFLVKNGDNFLNRPIIYTNQVLSHNFSGLSQARDKRWEATRNTFSSLSTNVLLRKKTYYVEEKIKETINHFANHQIGNKIKSWKFTKPLIMNIFYEYFQISEPFEQTMVDPECWELIEGLFDFVSKAQGKPLLNSNVFGLFIGLYHKLSDLKILKKSYSVIKKKLVDPHMDSIDRNAPRDTIDELILLNESYPKEQQFEHNVIAPIFDFLNAGLNSTSILMEWFLLIMANHPEVQEKIYEELSTINKSFISTKNRYKDTPYLNSVINEVIRYRLGTSTAPRETKEDIEIGGIFIPKGSRVAILTSSIFMDEDYWENPQQFIADRFIGEPKGHMERLLLYSVGKRQCVGKNLANDINYLFCSNMILNFKIKSSTNTIIDDTPIFKLNSLPISHKIILEKR
ncbi:hypothetical protein DICPUDRAFT_92221 [Dictyostelium purpureum]|uniref:Cytochrome P450 family protein n=1 Tax=Dictyostelium purpureum TaxID=5786 RepID=F0ZNN7_DICPU|nr:uncharacterized protein DICPUDRAFT_92221 [Dictyostelium purpureum]EGC34452.1 hypothetical protein DICPUDRAFT_92221 [Dictyostelium purpureum]|eukprot:XP_003289037.1 hypothetical protein DICPUDRAFT_92221 [Dictyostelium purpureum]